MSQSIQNTIARSVAVALFLVLQGCVALHGPGVMTGNANLSGGDFEAIKLAYGQAEAEYFLGLGGLKSKHLVLDAKRNMYLNYPLSKNQVYANITVDRRTAIFPFYTKVTATISADIIQFGDTANQSNKRQALFEPLVSTSIMNEPTIIKTNTWANIKPGDEVGVIKANRVDYMANFSEKLTGGMVTLIGTDSKPVKTKEQNIVVFSNEKLPPQEEFRIGTFLNMESFAYDKATVKVLALGKKYALVQQNNLDPIVVKKSLLYK